MLYLLYTLHIIVCLFLILVVLLQQGKGADLSVFGGGGTQAAFGPRGATTLLHKLTVWGFVAFTVLTIGIGFLTGRDRSGSVMEGVETEQSAPATPAPEPAAESDAAATAEPETATPAATEPGTAEPEATASEGAPAAATDAAPAEPEPGDTEPAPADDTPPAAEGEPEAADDPPPAGDSSPEGEPGDAPR